MILSVQITFIPTSTHRFILIERFSYLAVTYGTHVHMYNDAICYSDIPVLISTIIVMFSLIPVCYIFNITNPSYKLPFFDFCFYIVIYDCYTLCILNVT